MLTRPKALSGRASRRSIAPWFSRESTKGTKRTYLLGSWDGRRLWFSSQVLFASHIPSPSDLRHDIRNPVFENFSSRGERPKPEGSHPRIQCTSLGHLGRHPRGPWMEVSGLELRGQGAAALALGPPDGRGESGSSIPGARGGPGPSGRTRGEQGEVPGRRAELWGWDLDWRQAPDGSSIPGHRGGPSPPGRTRGGQGEVPGRRAELWGWDLDWRQALDGSSIPRARGGPRPAGRTRGEQAEGPTQTGRASGMGPGLEAGPGGKLHPRTSGRPQARRADAGRAGSGPRQTGRARWLGLGLEEAGPGWNATPNPGRLSRAGGERDGVPPPSPLQRGVGGPGARRPGRMTRGTKSRADDQGHENLERVPRAPRAGRMTKGTKIWPEYQGHENLERVPRARRAGRMTKGTKIWKEYQGHENLERVPRARSEPIYSVAGTAGDLGFSS